MMGLQPTVGRPGGGAPADGRDPGVPQAWSLLSWSS